MSDVVEQMHDADARLQALSNALEDDYPIMATAIAEIASWLGDYANQLDDEFPSQLSPHETDTAALIDLESVVSAIVWQYEESTTEDNAAVEGTGSD